MSIDTLTVRQLAGMAALNGPWARAAKRLLINSYTEFVELLLEDLDQAFKIIIQTRNLRKDEGEDRTTADIIMFLCARNYDAKHDEQHGGHCDIVVSDPRGYVWYAECKKHSSYDYLKQGFDQLSTRYMPGSVNADQGALILYVRNIDCASVLQEWKTRLIGHGYASLGTTACPLWGEHGFISTHVGTSAGRTLTIRHAALALHFDPIA